MEMYENKYTKDEIIADVLKYFEGDELATDVWIKKYCLKNSNGDIFYEKLPSDMHRRMAKEFHKIESNYKIKDGDKSKLSDYGKKRLELSESRIFDYFDNFKYIVPQGSVMSSLGDPFTFNSLSNCVVLPEIYDSYGGICFTDQQLVQLMKRRCVEEHSYVSTLENGIIKIKDVEVGMHILSFNVNNKNSEYKKIINKFDSDVSKNDRVKIAFSNGSELKTSLKHPILLFNDSYEYKKVNDVSINDVCIKPEKLKYYNFDENLKDIGWFIGAHLGDGTCGRIKQKSTKKYGTYIYNKLRFRILGDNENVISEYSRILNDLSGSKAKYKKNRSKRYKSDVWDYINVSNSLYNIAEEYLDNQIGKKVYAAKVPKIIFEKNLWIPFIAGLIDTDGYIKGNKTLCLRLCAKSVIDSISTYLSSIGVSYNVNIIYPKRSKLNLMYGITIHCSENIFTEEIKKYMKHDEKIQKLDIISNRPFSHKKYLNDFEYNEIIDKYKNIKDKNDNLISIIRYFNKDKNVGVGSLNEFLKNDLIDRKKYEEINQRIFIKSISKDEDSEHYVDIEVEDNNNFFAGNFGLINIHNCGVGIDISSLRPKDTPVTNSAGTSTGAISFMERFSNTTREVAQNNRRGALMITIDIKHIDVEDFISIKEDLKKVTGANISIRLSDEFMKAVKENTNFILKYPIDSDNPKFTKEVKAIDLWNKIVYSAWKSAEPGLVFWDRQHKYSTSSIYPKYKNISTNPCAEIAMGADSCRLIALNMFGCVLNPFTENVSFDFNKWYEISYEGQRLNDDLVDLELESIESILKKIDLDNEPDFIKDVERRTWKTLYDTGSNGRRTGLGFTALGDTLAALNLKYDSNESVEMIEKIMKVKCEAEFESSIDMAIERGSFVDFDPKIEETSEFVQMLKKEFPNIYKKMMKYGRRNISISTVAPNGSLSLLTRTTSGVEPLFMIEPYHRKKKVMGNDKYDFVDELGDKWLHFDVYHPKLKNFLDLNPDKTIKDSAYISAADIDWEKRVQIQSVIQKYITHSISSTINLSSNITQDIVSDIYLRGWELGLKGVTIYRDGSRIGVMTSKEDKKDYKDEKNYDEINVPKRPKNLHCDVMRFTNKGDKWVSFVGLIRNGSDEYRPYEIFTGLLDSFPIPHYVENGEIVKSKLDDSNGKIVSRYDFVYKDKDDFSVIMTGLNRAFDREYWNYGKMLSGVLRQKMPIKYVIALIDGLKFEEDNIVTWKAGVKRALKKYLKSELIEEKCPNCGSDKYFHEAGCDICKDCGFSAKCS